MKNLKIACFKDLLSIKTIESGEKLVNISKMFKRCICVYQQNDMISYTGEDLWVREILSRKLEKVSLQLEKNNPKLFLKIVYGYRHPEIQKFYFERRKKILLLENPNMDDDSLNELVNTMTAYPETAGHPTGGAVDLTICLEDGIEIDMGTKISDFSNPEKIKTYYEYLSMDQRNNRKLLHDLMVEEEFAPFYGEWWHFSYGDKEWTWFYNKPNALYDKIYFPK
jgi:D-alanyl-D-alanine dipeptidase